MLISFAPTGGKNYCLRNPFGARTNCVFTLTASEGESTRCLTVGIGRDGPFTERSTAGGDGKGDINPLKPTILCISHLNDEGTQQRFPGWTLLLSEIFTRERHGMPLPLAMAASQSMCHHWLSPSLLLPPLSGVIVTAAPDMVTIATAVLSDVAV